MTSFVTAIKIVKGYEDFVERLLVYIDCIATQYQGSDYEIIVVEDRNHLNVAYVKDVLDATWLSERKARIVEYEATYANPHGYNMIEAYAKNAGLKEAVYPYVCITNCDIFFNAAFFHFLGFIEPRVFYRFLVFETPPVATWNVASVSALLDQAVCLNPDLADPSQWNLKTVAYKSGDIMLLDRESWNKIKGFPENDVWVHSDLVVCTVARNNGFSLVVDPAVKIYTYPQERTVVEREFELLKSYDYLLRLDCN